MAAPVSNKCEKCFTTIPPGAATCPECGAPVGNASTAETEAGVYPELARANLARMRGDYKQAEDQLLSVLKRYPNNPSANEMLGDLAAEREDYIHAVEWYEMALEIVPTSASIARKVREARSKVDKKEEQDTTAQLGLPDPASRMPLIVGSLIVFILAIAAGAYILGARGGGAPKPTPTVNIQAQPPDTTSTTGSQPTDPNSAPKPVTSVQEEHDLLESLKAKSGDAGSIIAVNHDPRGGNLMVTFALSGKDDRILAARIGKDAVAALPGLGTNSVVLRGVSGGKIAYMADLSPQALAETETPDWKQQHENDPNAWVSHVLRSEWPNAAPAPTTGSNPPGADSTPPANSAGTGSTTDGTTATTGTGQ